MGTSCCRLVPCALHDHMSVFRVVARLLAHACAVARVCARATRLY